MGLNGVYAGRVRTARVIRSPCTDTSSLCKGFLVVRLGCSSMVVTLACSSLRESEGVLLLVVNNSTQ